MLQTEYNISGVMDHDGDVTSRSRVKRLQPNNVRCKAKQIAKRRAMNKNRKKSR